MKKNLQLKIVFVILLLFTGCTNTSHKKTKDIGPDANYYMGLKSLARQNYKEARVKLNKASKNGTSLVARRSAETLCTFGDVQEKVTAAKKLLLSYKDEDALLTACKVFASANEDGLILSNTSNISYKESDNFLVRLRLGSMEKRKLQGIPEAVKEWFLERPLSQEHLRYLEEAEMPLFWGNETEDSENAVSFIANFRYQVFTKNFTRAYLMLETLEELLKNNPEYFNELLVSDMGKTHLYGSPEVLKSARWFQSTAAEVKGSPMEFYCWFYAGRLFDKGSQISRAVSAYSGAVKSTEDISQKDNARWYLLKDSLSLSSDKCISQVQNALPELGDPYYYDDFFDLLANRLISEGKYEDIGILYKQMKGHASKEAVAKFAFIYGRLLEEKIYIPDDELLDGKTMAQEIQDALRTALDSGTDLYYKVVAAERLNLSEAEKETVFCSVRKQADVKFDPDAERLLNGYAQFGFPEKIYSEWVNLDRCILSEETALNLSRLLMKCSDGKDDYYPQSIRIAARCANYSPVSFSKELCRYCFPKCYGDMIPKYAEKYGIEPEVLFALIRSESFFDSDVTSSAGAIGLSQLMTFTADDVAKRLKRADYDLTDPETNIEFGAWYLGNLIGRLDGNYLDAFYSYNAGISRVRKWKQSSAFGFGLKNIPEDLFLETLPYAETREYGRKLVSATEMYKWAYTR